MPRCKAKNAHGDRCRAPESVVDPVIGLCPSHAPGARERMSEIGRKGAEAAAKRFKKGGLDPSELGSLATVRDTQHWLEVIGEDVVTGKLKPQEATAGVRAVETWLKAESERLKVEDLEHLLSTAIESCTGLAIENCTLGGGDEPLVRRFLLCSCSLSLRG